MSLYGKNRNIHHVKALVVKWEVNYDSIQLGVFFLLQIHFDDVLFSKTWQVGSAFDVTAHYGNKHAAKCHETIVHCHSFFNVFIVKDKNLPGTGQKLPLNCISLCPIEVSFYTSSIVRSDCSLFTIKYVSEIYGVLIGSWRN